MVWRSRLLDPPLALWTNAARGTLGQSEWRERSRERVCLKETHSSTQMAATPAEAGRVSAGMRACERRNWLEREVKPGNVQVRVAEFTKLSQRLRRERGERLFNTRGLLKKRAFILTILDLYLTYARSKQIQESLIQFRKRGEGRRS
jgi:hypothetical protein